MRTDTEMMNLILQIADTLEVEAIALSGSRTNPQATKDEFQDYDVVYIVDDLEELISDLSWLDQFGNRLIEQHNRIRTLTHCRGKLTALIVAHIAWRRANQTRHRVLFHVLGHIEGDKRIFGIEEKFRQSFGKLGFAHARRTKENK